MVNFQMFRLVLEKAEEPETQFLVQVLQVGSGYLKGHTVHRFRQTEIAMVQDVILIIDQHYGDIMVGLDDAQQEIHVGSSPYGITVLIHLVVDAHRQFPCRIGPNFHALALLLGEIFHQVVGYVKEERHQHQRDDNKDHLPDAS